ncbi:NAD(P)/FAD-dependent oxidoreductase [Streptomyces sp. NPDC097619]|uniref:phytoene desaturase family protein n=1 Tax=Streptomyces sp. NPDC097619 TaxID=3157228 RepID=UPI0033180D67
MARIAVIGAGMGAMATAARLAVAGHTVTVYERSDTHGGAVGRFAREGFAFDTGPTLLHLPAVYRDLFVKTGRKPLEDLVPLEQVDPAVRHVLPDGTVVSLPGASRGGAATALDAAFGTGAGDRWAAVLNRARDAWDATRRPLLEEPLWPDWQVLARDPYPALRKGGLLRRRPPTLAEVARHELGGPLGSLLEHRVLAYGLDPAASPAAAAVLPYMEQTFGSWYPRGGLRVLADAVHDRCRERRVEFRFGSAVDRVLESDGKASGLLLADGTEVPADAVVAGVDPRVLAGLLPDRALWPEGAKGPGEPRPSRLTVFCALRGPRPAGAAHRTLVHGAGGTGPAQVTVVRPDDPGTRPDPDHEAVTLTAVVPAGSGDPDGRLTATLLAAAEAEVPGLRDRLLWHETRTPADVAAHTGAPGGQVPAPALAGSAGGRLLHPANTTSLPGLYLAGGGAHPGGGLAHAGMTGALVAGLIVEGADFRGSR